MSVAGYWSVKPHRADGFSLVELLVVLMVVSVLYAMAGSLLSLAVVDPLQEAVERLHGRISLAQDEALVRSQPLAIGMDVHGYAFFLLSDQQKWEQLEDDALFKAYAFPKDYTPHLRLQGVDVVLDTLHPQIFVLPSGEMSAFEWRLRAENEQVRGISVDTRGVLTDLPLEGY